MKQCPKCGNSYTDDTLRFCLADGTLLAAADEQPTVIRGSDPNRTEQLPAEVTRQANEAVRVTIPGTETSIPQTSPPPSRSSRSVLLTILVAVLILAGLVVVGAAGILGFVYYLQSAQSNTALGSPTPAASPWSSNSASNNNDKKKLEDEIAKLKKQLEDSSNSNVDVTIDEDSFPGFGQKAVVNSPNDGFLALRNLPSADIGDRIAKIPHGTTIDIVICSEQSETIAGRTGHWCMATYENKTGWVFDVWLSFATDSKN